MPVQIAQDGVVLTNPFLETFRIGQRPRCHQQFAAKNSPVQCRHHHQCRKPSRLQRGAVGMDGVQLAVTNPFIISLQCDSIFKLGGIDQCGLQRAKRDQFFGELEHAGPRGGHHR